MHCTRCKIRRWYNRLCIVLNRAEVDPTLTNLNQHREGGRVRLDEEYVEYIGRNEERREKRKSGERERERENGFEI